jgi:hypothetical protein
MSIKVTCYFCNEELNEPGALLFSPPFSPSIFPYKSGEKTFTCDKFHICRKCFKIIISVKEEIDKAKKINKEKK